MKTWCGGQTIWLRTPGFDPDKGITGTPYPAVHPHFRVVEKIMSTLKKKMNHGQQHLARISSKNLGRPLLEHMHEALAEDHNMKHVCKKCLFN